MAINMQGPWTVSVTAKNAAWPQRFIVSGAASGNGTYNGVVGTAVFVTGAAWSIRVEHDPGSGFVSSAEQIKFPTVSGGQHRFQIESNDSGGDQDFDDLVLTCSTPQTESDFLVYGSVSHYSGGCIFNPCHRRPWVIDYAPSFQLALQNPALRKLVESRYPLRLIPPLVPPVGPGPGPEPFRPLVLDAEGGGIPAKQAIAVRMQDTRIEAPSKEMEAQTVRTVASARMVDAGSARLQDRAFSPAEVDRVQIARHIDKLFRLCATGPLPGTVLRFQEYDRTGAEMAGGPYTGEGHRETLGVCTTDRNGNYVFRFQRTLAQRFDEADVDTAAGEDELVQSAPDVIVQVLDPMARAGCGGKARRTGTYPCASASTSASPARRPSPPARGRTLSSPSATSPSARRCRRRPRGSPCPRRGWATATR